MGLTRLIYRALTVLLHVCLYPCYSTFKKNSQNGELGRFPVNSAFTEVTAFSIFCKGTPLLSGILHCSCLNVNTSALTVIPYPPCFQKWCIWWNSFSFSNCYIFYKLHTCMGVCWIYYVIVGTKRTLRGERIMQNCLKSVFPIEVLKGACGEGRGLSKWDRQWAK